MDNIPNIRKSGDSWAEWENDILRSNYIGYGALKRCMPLLPHRSKSAIQSQATRYLGLQAIHREDVKRWRKPWLDWEDEYLEKHHQTDSLYTMARRLKRTSASVALRTKRLGLNRLGRDGWYTLSDVATVFGCSKNTVGKLIKDNALKAKRRFENDSPNNLWEIKEIALYEFMTNYPDFMQGKIVDMLQVVNILTKGDIKYKV